MPASRHTPELVRTTMRLDRNLKKKLKSRAAIEGRKSIRLLAIILRERLDKDARFTPPSLDYKPVRDITTVRLSKTLLAKLDRRAKAEERSSSNLVEIALHDALIERKAADNGTVFD